MILANEYKERRQKVFDVMEKDSVMVLFSGCELKATADHVHEFQVNTNFFYLTGITQKDSALVLFKYSKARTKAVLIINKIDPFKVKWTGKMLSVEEAHGFSGIDDIVTLEGDEDYLTNEKLLRIGDPFKFKNVYLDLEEHLWINMDLTTRDLADKFTENKAKVLDAFPLLIKFRMIKSPAEIDEIKASIEVTNLGLQAILKNLKPNKFEYQMASLFEYTIKDHNNSGLSFPTICASGSNAVILHYPTPDDVMRDNTLLLLDLGAEKNMYRADITRTYPVNGKFTLQQKEIYEIVLRCNRAVQQYMRPGVTLRDCQDFTFDFLKAELINRGYVSVSKAHEEADELIAKQEKESNKVLSEEERKAIYLKCINGQVSKYYYHGVSHHLGLDVHDQSERGALLEPGMVITDEPGLYMAEYGIGVRIEDDVLITKDGSMYLSDCIVKDVDEIEKYMEINNK